ncbi:MAG: ComF family protein [Alistipes sp.]|nr:ComF family protein [Alistipes sp.]
MWMLGNSLSAIMSLLFPRVCPVCDKPLGEGERDICTLCRNDIPLTGFICEADNLMEQRFWGYLPIERAAALFWFVEGSGWRKLIHDFKYAQHWYTAEMMGRWMGIEMKRSGRFDDIDLIVPIPLHWRKRLARGYNQSEYIARGLAQHLAVPCDFSAVRRTHYNKSQTRKRRTERWGNVSGIFGVRRPEHLRGRHILLVDDVFTTGATISSCAEAIIEACDGDVRISVATLAASRRALE